MGNEFSEPTGNNQNHGNDGDDNKTNSSKQKPAYAEFFSSAGKTIHQASGVVCGSLSDTFEETDRDEALRAFKSSNKNSNNYDIDPDEAESMASLSNNPMSQLFARALLNEVTDNPSTMTPAKMADREKKLLKAQQRANQRNSDGHSSGRAIGGQGSLQMNLGAATQGVASRIIPPNLLSEHRAQVRGDYDKNGVGSAPQGKYSVTIGLMLSRRDENGMGNGGTVTRQTAFDFNELQDRDYKYVSSTDSSGWRAGGGEKGGPSVIKDNLSNSLSDDCDNAGGNSSNGGVNMGGAGNDNKPVQPQKIPAADVVHIPIIHIDCDSEPAVNAVIAALARGEVFIPHMSVMPEALGVNGISPPDLVVRFGCERNDDFPPEEWPNWCLEFMHNQLYEYFSDMGARWMKRPFQITLAKKVRWKTVKHMNKFFAHSETVINSWREKGPQYLDPQLTHIDGGATPEEVARPHGIYLLRNGKPTNYFAPNFEPPYTTKMTRSLLQNVMAKSWDKKRRDWSTQPIPIVTPSLLFSTMCGCAEPNPNQGGFIAREATNHFSPIGGGTFFGDAQYDNDLGMHDTMNMIINANGNMNNMPMQMQGMQGMKLQHQDSGIRRSEIAEISGDDQSHMTPRGQGQAPMPMQNSPQRDFDASSVRSGRSARSGKSGSQRTEASVEQSSTENNYGFHQQQQQIHNSNSFGQHQQQQSPVDSRASGDFNTPYNANALSGDGESPRMNYSNDSEENGKHTLSGHDLSELDFTSPSNGFNPNPADVATPLMNNHIKQMQKPQDREGWSKNNHKNRNSNSLPQRPNGEENNTTRSVSPAEGTATVSVGESQTTVPIMNRSSAKYLEQERERRKQRELEREKERKKIDELELAIQEKLRLHEEKKKKLGGVGAGTGVTEFNPVAVAQTEAEIKKNKKKEKKAKKEKKKREKKERRSRSRSRNRSKGGETSWNEALKEESGSNVSTKENHVNRSYDGFDQQDPNGFSAFVKSDRGAGSGSLGKYSDIAPESAQDNSYLPVSLAGSSNNSSRSPHKRNQNLFTPNSPGGLELNQTPSMDYSMDTASLLGDGSLIGGQFAGDSSVFTMGTNASDNRSLLSYVTRSTVHDMGRTTNTKAKKKSSSSTKEKQSQSQSQSQSQLRSQSQEDEDGSLSLMASSSTMGEEQVPSDDDLFAVGWAKALDPSSGCYYYFTLDRTQTVWENPLRSSMI